MEEQAKIGHVIVFVSMSLGGLGGNAAGVDEASPLERRVMEITAAIGGRRVVHKVAPGDGLCMFYVLARGFGQAEGWDRRAASELYVEALDGISRGWVDGENAVEEMEGLSMGMIPETVEEEERYMRKLRELYWEQPEGDWRKIVVASKMLAVTARESCMDSWHYGGGQELMALSRLYNQEVLAWGVAKDENYLVRAQSRLTDMAAGEIVRGSPAVVQMLFHGLHYDWLHFEGEERRWREERPDGWSSEWRSLLGRGCMEQLQAAVRSRCGCVERTRLRAVADGRKKRRLVQLGCTSVGAGGPCGSKCSGAHGRAGPCSSVSPMLNEGERKVEQAVEDESEGITTWSDTSTESEDGKEEVGLLLKKWWKTKEDMDLEKARKVKERLREEPLLPMGVEDGRTGECFPSSHCSFQQCCFKSMEDPCDGWRYRKGTWYIDGWKWRKGGWQSATECCGKEDCLWNHLLKDHLVELETMMETMEKHKLLEGYMEGIRLREMEKIPAVGWSIDRRVIGRVGREMQEKNCRACICLVCGRIGRTGTTGDIAYVQGKVLFNDMKKVTFDENFCKEKYAERYACKQKGLMDIVSRGLWTRVLEGGPFAQRAIICCPEDIECVLGHAEANICPECWLPVCGRCWEGMRCGSGCVPEALCNDNLMGFGPSWLYEYKVRYIEAAAAAPVFTSMVTWYVEGDAGHLLEEDLHKPRHQVFVRGNVASFAMNWEEMYGAMASSMAQKPGEVLPHGPDVLARLVQFHLRVGKDTHMSECLIGSRLRPFVVIMLLELLLERKHPCTAGHDIDVLREQFRERCLKLYPETEADVPLKDRKGATPKPVLEAMLRLTTKRGHGAATDLMEKSATPGDGMEGNEDSNGLAAGVGWGGGVRPEVMSGDNRRAGEGPKDLVGPVALAKQGTILHAETGSKFLDMWKGSFVFDAFPFSLPEVASGADWPLKDRERRHRDAAILTPMSFARMLAGRVEGCIRNSWDLVPAMRRVATKWFSVTGAHATVKHKVEVGKPKVLQAAELVQAAKKLYSKLQTGKWWDGSKYRHVNHDVTKLQLVKDLGPTEAKLLQDIQARQRVLPGSREVRRVVGRALFGMRVEHGEPLFVTISPTLRHSGLTMRFTRYRREDPARSGLAEKWGGQEEPKLFKEEGGVELPRHEVRKILAARDPWASVLAFQHAVRCILGQVFGVRWCSRCPACDCTDGWGSNALAMGGAAGLCTAIAGAVEYQRNAAPHFHGNVYLRHAWQRPIQEIATLIEKELLEPEKLMEYHQWLHREEHYDLDAHMDIEKKVEEEWFLNWPTASYDELAILPALVEREGRQKVRGINEKGQEEGKKFIEEYSQAAQYVFSRSQHHVHKLDARSGMKVPLNACGKKGNCSSCKHGFPLTKKLGLIPKIVCPGNARRYGLRCAGRRNALGCVVGRRNNEWLSGTLGLLAVLVRGNSNTSPNYRIPLTEKTHDPNCRNNCLKKESAKKMQRAMCRAGQRTTGYFGGYIQKGQPISKAEVARAAKQLDFLSATIEGKEAKGQYMAVANRMLGDLEYRGTIRPTTEEFQLAGQWEETNVASAEFLTTADTVKFLGYKVTRRGEEIERVLLHKAAWKEIDVLDLYGVRGKHEAVYYLSPWELVKWWKVEKVVAPNQYRNEMVSVTEWVDKKKGTYRVRTSGVEKNVVVLPQCCETEHVREEVVLRLRERPVVPRPVGGLPRHGMGKEAQGRLLNRFLRPWVSVRAHASTYVPYIEDLDIPFEGVGVSRRIRGKRTIAGKGRPERSQARAWATYCDGHVVSEHACQMIEGFLAATECRLHHEDAEIAEEEKGKYAKEDVDTSWVDLDVIRGVIGATEESGGSKKAKNAAAAAAAFWDQGNKETAGVEVWKGGQVAASEDEGEQEEAQYRDEGKENDANMRLLYGKLTRKAAAAWLRSKRAKDMKVKATEEQEAFLKVVVERCLKEQTEEAHDCEVRSEPVRMLFHGVPGAGKSQCFHWIREFFEEICGFEHGREFVFLAPQNTQAALIGGKTLHAFGHIDISKHGKSGRKGDTSGNRERNKWFIQYQRLRWILIDEVSLAGLEILGMVHQHLSAATRDRGTWKMRKQGEEDGNRINAGVNSVYAGDCWQFPAVKATSIFSDPTVASGSSLVQRMQSIFWTKGVDSLTHFRELTKEHRCVDSWLSYFLHGARHGQQREEVWAFAHGLPTRVPGSWNFLEGKAECGIETCEKLRQRWAHEIERLVAGDQGRTWGQRRLDECRVCQEERKRRCIVAGVSDLSPDKHDPKFSGAPFIHSLNAAKYSAAQIRAKEYAKREQKLCLWAVAQDRPLFDVDKATSELTGRHWLAFHDQQTGGVCGILPLVIGMPVRVTQTIPALKDKQVFKNSRGKLVGWHLHAVDLARVETTSEAELILQYMPVFVVVDMEGAAGGRVKLKPVQVTWSVTKDNSTQVQRKGLPIAADFSGTSHSFAGATLPACAVDIGGWEEKPTKQAQLAGYMSVSRVRQMEDVLIVGPFGPGLFRQGDQTGPRMLIDFQRGEVEWNFVAAEFQRVGRKKGKSCLWPQSMELACRICSDRRGSGSEVYRRLQDFEHESGDVWKVLREGMERCCKSCKIAAAMPGQKVEEGTKKKMCRWCKVKEAVGDWCVVCAATKIECQSCKKRKSFKKHVHVGSWEKKLTEFDPNRIEVLRKMKMLRRRATCKECESLGKGKTSVKYTCSSYCGRSLGGKAFAAKDIKKYTLEGGYLECKKCGARSGRESERKESCPKCKEYVPKILLNVSGVCESCAAQTCARCGVSLPKATARRNVKYCGECSYPPCQCGKARPKNGKYHISKKWDWKCHICEKEAGL